MSAFLAPTLLRIVPMLIAAVAGAPPTTTLWAGHAVVTGTRRVPILGRVQARTETFVLAEVVEAADRVTIKQKACTIEFSNPAGATLTVSPSRAERLPEVELVFTRAAEEWRQGPITTGWDTEDADADGHPGLTIEVDAPVCSGKLFVGVMTTTQSRGQLIPGGGIRGQMKNKLVQHVLDSDSLCLAALIKSSEEQVRGNFAYTPVPAGSTCASLARDRWPQVAEPHWP